MIVLPLLLLVLALKTLGEDTKKPICHRGLWVFRKERVKGAAAVEGDSGRLVGKPEVRLKVLFGR